MVIMRTKNTDGIVYSSHQVLDTKWTITIKNENGQSLEKASYATICPSNFLVLTAYVNTFDKIKIWLFKTTILV